MTALSGDCLSGEHRMCLGCRCSCHEARWRVEVVYTYIRRGARRRAQCHTLDQALRLAWYHRESGGAWPVQIATREDDPIFDQRGLRVWMDRDEFPA